MLGDAHRYAWRRCEHHPGHLYELGGQSQGFLRAQWWNRLHFLKCSSSCQMGFNVQQIDKARVEYPGIKILVHPECRREVVEAADLYGSTEYIIKQVEQAPAGSQWAIATEINLVHRLAKAHPEQFIFCLDPIVCPCSTMYRIHPAYLAWVLEGLVDGEVINQVIVDDEIVYWARVALERMLAL